MNFITGKTTNERFGRQAQRNQRGPVARRPHYQYSSEEDPQQLSANLRTEDGAHSRQQFDFNQHLLFSSSGRRDSARQPAGSSRFSQLKIENSLQNNSKIDYST